MKAIQEGAKDNDMGKYDTVIEMIIDIHSKEMAELQAENDRLRKAFLHFAECVNTVKKHNTEEWMEYIEEEIDKVDKLLFTTEEE